MKGLYLSLKTAIVWCIGRSRITNYTNDYDDWRRINLHRWTTLHVHVFMPPKEMNEQDGDIQQTCSIRKNTATSKVESGMVNKKRPSLYMLTNVCLAIGTPSSVHGSNGAKKIAIAFSSL